MTDVRFTREIVLDMWIQGELISLWHNLQDAHRFTYGNNGVARRDRAWSVGADDIAERIKAASTLVGSVDPRNISINNIADGWFVWASEKIGIENFQRPSDDMVEYAKAYMDRKP